MVQYTKRSKEVINKMEFILGLLFVVCFMIGTIELLAAFAITIGWFAFILFGLIGIALPFFIFMTMFASFPFLTGFLVIALTIWVIVFIIKKGFQGIKACINEIKRYFEERDYRKYK